ncbi:ATP-dependent helicase [Thiomonas sp.]
MATQPLLLPDAEPSVIQPRPRPSSPLEREIAGLNPEQQAIVTAPLTENLAILAGAGTGKTRVLTYRIAWLIAQGADPAKILALTFTNKAAREIQERLRHLLPNRNKGLRTGTFHGIGLRWLKQYGGVLGLSRNLQCLDDDDVLALIRRLMKLDSHWRLNHIKPEEVRPALSHWKERCYRYGMVHQVWPGLSPTGGFEPAAQADGPPAPLPLLDLYLRYEAEKARNAVLDFDDLMLVPNRLFAEYAEAREAVRQAYDFVLADEFQDTDPWQYQLLETISQDWKKARTTVVGDDDQSLYSWRGASPDILPRFIAASHACLHRLEENYRCGGAILEAANAVIDRNLDRLGKTLWTRCPDRTPITFEVYQDSREEARRITQRVQSLRQQGVSPAEIVVLYRKNRFSSDLEAALLKSGIPYRVYGGTDFYRRQEIKDALAYLRLIAHPEDDLALRRVINVPPRGIGTAKLGKLADRARYWGCSLFDAARGLGDDKLRPFVQMVSDWRPAWSGRDLAALLKIVLDETRLRQWYATEQSNLEKGEAQAERLGTLLESAAEFEDRWLADSDRAPNADLLADFLAETVLEADATAGKDTPAVSLMTIHRAKGLEFQVVFIVALEDGEFPSPKAPIEEERRLFHVAITRAKRHLFLSRAKRRFQFGRLGDPVAASEFLRDLPKGLLVFPQRLTVAA